MRHCVRDASARNSSRRQSRTSSRAIPLKPGKSLKSLLEKYAEHGDAQFVLPDALRVPPISNHGQIGEIIDLFGGANELRNAVSELQGHLYAV